MEWKKRGNYSSVDDFCCGNLGIKRKEEIEEWMKKSYKIEKLPQMANELKATELPIYVIGDYDADGISATSILFLGLNNLGKKVEVRLPRRFSEGYGLSSVIIKEMLTKEKGIVLLVDNGIASAEAVEELKEYGHKVYILDHHMLRDDGKIPNADILIDPSAFPNEADFEHYCGAGLSFKLICLMQVDVSIQLAANSLAAIGTVADAVPLIEDNFKIVRTGLKSLTMKKGLTNGMYKLLSECDLLNFITEENLGFKIGPIINASGRLEDDGPMDVFNLLTSNTKNISELNRLCSLLLERNEIRKKLVEEQLALIDKSVEKAKEDNDNFFVIYHPNLHEGIIGILAGRIAEKFNVPTIVLTNSNGMVKGSARTACGVHVKNELDKVSDLLYRYGGHPGAAGLSLKPEKVDLLKKRLNKNVSYEKPDMDVLFYDLELSIYDVEKTINDLSYFAPFGQNNPKPIFKITNYSLRPGTKGSCFEKLGERKGYWRLNNPYASGMLFGNGDEYLPLLENSNCFNLLGELGTNYFNGVSSNQIIITEMQESKTKNNSNLQQLLTQRKNSLSC